MNTDPVIILGLAFILGALFGAVCVEMLVARHLNRERAETDRLRQLLSLATKNDVRDPRTGRYVGSSPSRS